MIILKVTGLQPFSRKNIFKKKLGEGNGQIDPPPFLGWKLKMFTRVLKKSFKKFLILWLIKLKGICKLEIIESYMLDGR